jgi:dethiobiotin synthetase
VRHDDPVCPQLQRIDLNRLLVTGTAAGSGKTLLIKALSHYIQTYAPGHGLQSVALGPSLHPSLEGALPPEQLWPILTQQPPEDLWLIDSPGSLGTPITPETTLADLAWDWRLPTILVVPISSATVEQAVAFSALARQARVVLRGIVLNCQTPISADQCQTWASEKLLTRLTNVPVLGSLPYLESPEQGDLLAAAAAGLTLEVLLPPVYWSRVLT